MELKLIKATWGMTGTLEEQFRQMAEAGYAGVEAPLPAAEEEKRFKRLLAEYDFAFIAEVVTSGGNDAAAHAVSFAEQVNRAAEFGPILIDAHSAKDSMPFADQCRFFEQALAIEHKTGIPIGHETHRGRPTFTPWNTADLLREFPELKLTADVSHWFCVCESSLDDQAENMDLVCQRSIHIHGRVGYAEGPQVPHPAAPEYARELALHEAIWERICKYRVSAGAPYMTFNPEFGPPGYMHTLPFTRQPVANLWEVCLWMGQRFERNFNHFLPS